MKSFKKGKLKADDFNYLVSESVKKFDRLDDRQISKIFLKHLTYTKKMCIIKIENENHR